MGLMLLNLFLIPYPNKIIIPNRKSKMSINPNKNTYYAYPEPNI